jgi:hypothetical protein
MGGVWGYDGVLDYMVMRRGWDGVQYMMTLAGLGTRLYTSFSFVVYLRI